MTRFAWAKQPLVVEALVIAGYVLLTLVFTYPLSTNLATMVVGLNVDSEAYLWSFWWMHKVVTELHTNPYYSTWIYYPEGTSLYFYGHNVVREFLSVPIQALFSLIVGYNVTSLLGFVVAAYTAYWLGCFVTGSRRAGVVAGLVFGFAPTQVFHFNVGQPNIHAVEFVPLYVLCVLRWLGGEHYRWLLGAVIALVLCCLSDWQLAVYLHLFTGIALLALLLRTSQKSWRAKLWGLGWRAAALETLYAVVISPILVPMLLEASSSKNYMFRGRHDSIHHSSDLLAFFVPNPAHPLWGEWATQMFDQLRTPGILVTVVSLSYIALFLAVVACMRNWRQSRFWVWCGLVFAILALGPQLRVMGQVTDMLLPYEALFQIGIIRVSRAPARYAIITVLCLAVLAAIGTRVLLAKHQHTGTGTLPLPTETHRHPPPTVTGPSSRPRQVVFALIVAALCFELLPVPVNAGYPPNPPAFLTDGTLREAGALMEIPNPSNRGMYYATIHEHPVMYAELSRDNPPGPLLEYLRERVFDEEIVRTGQGWQCVMNYYNITHMMVYHKEAATARLEQRVIEHLGESARIRTSPEISLYQVPTSDVADTCLLFDDEGWSRPRLSGPGEPLYRWMAQQGMLGVIQRADGTVRLHFNAHSFAVPRTIEVYHEGDMVAQFEVAQPEEFVLELDLPAGLSWLEFRSVEPALDPTDYGYEREDMERVSIGIGQMWAESESVER
jgi:hypothetical protein